MLLTLSQAIPMADPSPIPGRALVTMIVVLAVLAAVAWWLRQRVGAVAGARATLSVESAISLGERRSLVIVTVEDRRLLLGLTPSQVSLVAELRPGFSAQLSTATAVEPRS